MCVVNEEGDLAECEGLRCHTLPYCPSYQWLNDARAATPSSDHQEVGVLLAHTKAVLLMHALSEVLKAAATLRTVSATWGLGDLWTQ